MAAINIRGLKISGELFLIRLQNMAPKNRLLPAFCSIMAGSQINMPFLSTERHPDGIRAACCVESAHQALVKRLVDHHPQLQKLVKYRPAVGLLTMFPHHSNLKFFGISLRTLAKADLQIFAMASSIGALTYVLDYSRLDEAAALLQMRFNLAENHAPFRAEFTVSQGTQTRSGHTDKT